MSWYPNTSYTVSHSIQILYCVVEEVSSIGPASVAIFETKFDDVQYFIAPNKVAKVALLLEEVSSTRSAGPIYLMVS